MGNNEVLKNPFEAVRWLKSDLESLCNHDVIVYYGATTRNGTCVDGIVVFSHIQVAVIQFSPSDDSLQYYRKETRAIMRSERIPIGIIISNKRDLYVYKREDVRFKQSDISTIAKVIQEEYGSYKKTLDKGEVRQKILKMFEDGPSFEKKEIIRRILEEGSESLVVESGLVYLSEEYEDRLFVELLCGKDDKVKKVCRYTSLSGLFHLLNTQKHAMCSPVSMNDRHECDYADSFMPWYVKKARDTQDIEIDNSYFLLSCSKESLSDVLTMWRLYGDDTKGVCIEYEIDHRKIDNKHFFLAPVSYGKKNGRHPELEFIVHMEEDMIEPGWYFSFNRWYIWKFYFKSADYADEEEVRLLYIPDWNEDQDENVKWYIDASNSIFNRMVLLPIDFDGDTSFPLTISKIILGPNSPESSKNVEQISLMLNMLYPETMIGGCVNRSRIDNYRLPRR